MMSAYPILLAFAAGIFLFVQQALNANLRGVVGSAAWASLFSYMVGLACMAALVIALRDPAPSLAAIARSPWWTWTGGVFGALFIALSIVLLPKLGGATFIALLVAGQMAAALAFDHWGLLGAPVQSANLIRIAGACLVVAGVVLIRW